MLNPAIAASMGSASWIRRVFEAGRQLKAERGAANVCDFSLGNPHLEPPAAVLARLRELAADPEVGRHCYMTNAGYPEVRAKLAAAVSEREGVATPGSHVLMTCGAAGAINIAFRTLLAPGDEAILFAPCFAEYRFYCQHAGAVPVVVPPRADFDLDAGELAKRITPRTRLVLVNSPCNPTGRVIPAASLAAVAEVLKAAEQRHGRPIVLFADDPYRALVYDGARVAPVLPLHDATMIATSFSKDLGLAGERIGYLAVSPRFPQAATVLEGLAFCLRTLGFVNAPALMQRLVADFGNAPLDVAPYQRNRDALLAGLRAAGYTVRTPEGAFFLFPQAPGGDDVAFVNRLMAAGTLTVPGIGFEAPGHFRISYAVPPETVARSLPSFAAAFAAP